MTFVCQRTSSTCNFGDNECLTVQDPAAKQRSREAVLKLFDEVSSCTTPSSVPQQPDSRLGNVRSILDLHALCGVNYRKQVMNDAAKRGIANDSILFANDKQTFT